MDPHYDPKLRRLQKTAVKSLSFRPFTDEEVERLSVVKIVTSLTFDSLGNPLPGSLYDTRMGPLDGRSGSCDTCKNMATRCPGHFGHIELPLPVINPIFHKALCSLFRVMCMSCGRILINPVAQLIFSAQVRMLDCGQVGAALDLGEKFETLPSLWTSKDVSENVPVAVSEQIECALTAALAAGPVGDVVEARGDGELRNSFFRSATSHDCSQKRCPFCGEIWKTFSVVGGRMFCGSRIDVASKFGGRGSSGNGPGPLLPSEAKRLLRVAWEKDQEFLGAAMPILQQSVASYPTDLFFVSRLLVPPTITRPVNFRDGMRVEHPQNAVFREILNSCLVVRTLLAINSGTEIAPEKVELAKSVSGSSTTEKLANAWYDLQTAVTAVVDGAAKRDASISGLKQIIEKKVGVVRMHMMGKRVDFAARSVITPDPHIGVDEVGVPGAFAMTLTYPTYVTQWNVEELRKRIINGPAHHPGANSVQNEDGLITRLDANDKAQREAVAKKLLVFTNPNGVKVVHRHLVNGDALLLNRQPTLHRPSIMAHKARILLGERTFRLHYSNCKSYNADFDGDEMNAHFPQNEVARSEAYNLVAVGHQYLVPKDGSPLGGLIQDHVVAAVRMTVRGKFFLQNVYHQLVFQALNEKMGTIQLLPPAMLKPRMLWSGKQIVSTVILNVIPRGASLINLQSTSKISVKAWERKKRQRYDEGGSVMSEAEVLFHRGQLLVGVLDKVHCGATPFGLIHSVYELYGGQVACHLLSALSRLFTAFLQIEGFTLGVKDILVTKDANRQRWRTLREARNIGVEAAARALHCRPEEVTPEALEKARHSDPDFRAVLDAEYKSALDQYTNDVNRTCLGEGLVSKFPDNNLQLMVQSGAKGSTVNTMQISCLLGQIELEGRRPPLCISGRALPSFRPHETSPRAGGFVDSRFMTGIRPQEFFFHCMAGREGLIDTACKTSRSGYLQRCLVKHLEGLVVAYDGTVRDSDGCVIQWLYGEDGLDICKSQLLNKLPLLTANIETLHPSEIVTQESKLLKMRKPLRKWHKKHKHDDPGIKSGKRSPFSVFSSNYPDPFSKEPLIHGRSVHAMDVCNKWLSLPLEEKAFFKKVVQAKPDCVNSRFQPASHLGSVSEKLDAIIESYIKKAGGDVEGERMRIAILERARAAASQAGDPVGLLAAQSVGEPSTQMTLNTFHFAGRGEMNVTLGIPRLRELLMVASSSIKTPAVDVPLRADLPDVFTIAQKLKKELNRVYLSDVLETVNVVEDVQLGARRSQTYTIRLNFLPKKVLQEFTSLSPKAIVRHVEKKFIAELTGNIRRKQNSIQKIITMETEFKTKKRFFEDPEDENDGEEPGPKREFKGVNSADNDASSDEEPQADDEDATAVRRRERQNEEQQYSDIEDMEDEEVIRELAEDEEEKYAMDVDDPEAEVKTEEGESSGTAKRSVVDSISQLEDYRYDDVKYRWCEFVLSYSVVAPKVDFVSLLKELTAQSIVRQVRGIRRGHVVQPNDGGPPILRTEGVNLQWLYEHAHVLDVNKLYSNDVHAIASCYGIEAASRVLIKEIEAVFEVYGIKVDRRHLSLIADYMMWSGEYKPLNRKGMEIGVSPLQQISFESSLTTLRTSHCKARTDHLENPSARLIVGRPVAAGTGYCHVISNLNTFWPQPAVV